MRLPPVFVITALLFAGAAPGQAAELKPIATIAIPGKPLDVFGAIFVDSALHRAFLTDRSNKGIDVIDTAAEKFVARIGGFVGVAKTSSISGPQGVVPVNGGTQIWATDGDSTVKIIDLAAGKIVDSISTGGKKRTGELAYDPFDHIVLVTNPDERPQYVTVISTAPGHKIIGKIVLAQATEGIERPAYSLRLGMFYVPVPSLDPARAAGGIAEIDARLGKLMALVPTAHCNPHSLMVVSENRALIGCNYGKADAAGPKGQLVVLDPVAKRIVATSAGLGGDGETAADIAAGRYYAASNKEPGGSVLKVVDVENLRSVQTIHTWYGSHSVAVDGVTHRVYLPAAAKTAPCGGCVEVFAAP